MSKKKLRSLTFCCLIFVAQCLSLSAARNRTKLFNVPDAIGGIPNADVALTGSLMYSVKTRSRLECAMFCLREPDCLSLNVDRYGTDCELNSELAVEGNLVYKKGFRYLSKESLETTTPATTSGACPEGFSEYNNHCYYFEADNSSTWQEAKTACAGKGAYLAELTSEEENTFVANLISNSAPTYGYAWIGGVTVSANTRQWDHSGLPLTQPSFTAFTDWSSFEDYVLIYCTVTFGGVVGDWADCDDRCASMSTYVCELDL